MALLRNNQSHFKKKQWTGYSSHMTRHSCKYQYWCLICIYPRNKTGVTIKFTRKLLGLQLVAYMIGDGAQRFLQDRVRIQQKYKW